MKQALLTLIIWDVTIITDYILSGPPIYYIFFTWVSISVLIIQYKNPSTDVITIMNNDNTFTVVNMNMSCNILHIKKLINQIIWSQIITITVAFNYII